MLAAGTAAYDWPDFEALDKVPEALRAVVDTLRAWGFPPSPRAPGMPSTRLRMTCAQRCEKRPPQPPSWWFTTPVTEPSPERDTYYLVTKQSLPANFGRTALAARDLLSCSPAGMTTVSR